MNKTFSLSALLLALLLPLSAQEKPKEWDLTSCIQYALDRNITLQKSRNSYDQSQVDVRTAQAALFPSLSFSSSQNYANQPYGGVGSVGSSFNDGSIHTYSGNYSLSARLTLYNGNKNRNNIRYNRLQAETAQQTIEEQKNQIILAVTEAYLQILYAAESITINQHTLQTDSAQLARTRQLLQNGLKTRTDVAQLESQLSNDAYQLVQAQNQLDNYKLQLRQLLEIQGDEEMPLTLPELEDADVIRLLPGKDEVYRTALQIMPEIKSSRLSTQAAQLNEKIAKSGYLPSISLQASTGTGHNSVSDLNFGQQLKRSWNNSVGLTLSLPIFDNRSTKSAVEKAKLQTLSSKLEESEQAKTLYKTIETAWQNAYASQNEFMAAAEKEKYAEESYNLVSEQYAVGLKNTVELLTEKNTLLSARQQKVQAKYLSLLNQKLLRFYQGETPAL